MSQSCRHGDSYYEKKISGALREWAPFAECIKKFLCSRAPPSSLQSGIKKFMSSDVLQHGVQREQDSPGGGGDFGLGGDIIGAWQRRERREKWTVEMRWPFHPITIVAGNGMSWHFMTKRFQLDLAVWYFMFGMPDCTFFARVYGCSCYHRLNARLFY